MTSHQPEAPPPQPGRPSLPEGWQADLAGIEDAVVRQVRAWLAMARTQTSDPAARRLAALLADPGGLPFVVAFVDGVVRPEDPRTAAARLRDLARDLPSFLPLPLRASFRAGAALSTVAPHTVVRIAGRVLREMVGHLVVDASEDGLGEALARLSQDGDRLNLNLLGEAVLGVEEADRRLQAVLRLVERPDVHHVSVKVSSVTGPHSPWAHEETVAEVVERLAPLYRRASAGPSPTFVNLDMEEYRDLELTLDAFTTLLDDPDLLGYEAGIVLQAYLPDSLAALERLQRWAARRRAAGGAPVRVRIVKGANLPMERVDAEVHGWPLATWGSKQETDTHYKRLLLRALDPERTGAVRVGVAGHNLFDLAFAWELAGRRGVREAVVVEMLLGMASAQAAAVRGTVGPLVVYTPVVHPDQFDVAIAYLVRRLDEGANEQNFMSAVFGLDADPALFRRELDRFRASLAQLDDRPCPPRRTPAALHQPDEPDPTEQTRFHNAVDLDPSVPAHRDRVRERLLDAVHSEAGAATAHAARVHDLAHLDLLLTHAQRAGRSWGLRSPGDRADRLEQVADALERHRLDLVEVMVSECGKTADQADPEVSEAVDFARFYAASARAWGQVDGAEPVPVPLTLVTPPWNFPVAIPAGGVLAALAAGSGVVLKPSGAARRCGALLAEILWEAGLPRGVLTLAVVDEGEVSRALVADPRFSRVLLTGAFETAELFDSFRPGLPLLAETSGKNAVVVTPHADLDLAVRDVVTSAFGHAGQKCSAGSLAILVGAVGRSRRFETQLRDAVSSLRVGPAWEAVTQMGPLTGPARGKLLDALTTLQPGERWLVHPHRLDESGRLWTPGVKDGVRRGSPFHLTEYFGPVLGVMRARTLDEAVAIQNQVSFGLTAGLHSLDADEIAQWLAGVQAGNLYVNRHVTGAVVQRQPFGGWKRSVVGSGFKAGGRNHLVGLADWRSRPASYGVGPGELGARILSEGARVLSDDDLAFLERSVRSDAAAWREEFTVTSDPTGLCSEVNAFRYLSVRTAVRVDAQTPAREVLRVVAAGLRASALAWVSLLVEDPELRRALEALGVQVRTETGARCAATVRGEGIARLRLLTRDRTESLDALGVGLDVAVHGRAVVESGRVELLAFLAEQAISITAHRFGTPSDLPRVLGEVDRTRGRGVGPYPPAEPQAGPVR